MKGSMQDDFSTMAIPPRPRTRVGGYVIVGLAAFLLGAASLGALVWHGDFERLLPARTTPAQADAGVATPPADENERTEGSASSRAAVTSLETRLALLEDRFSRLDFQADAASGNAARAEGLLIANAARRMIERGEPLGYVADQLRLRFADAQPRAVATITEFARRPVTLDQLSARLEALAPDLTNNSQDLSWWQRTRQELSSLFVVRRDSPTLVAPAARIERARLMLTARRMGAAIDEVERLPGAELANNWIADARRFQNVQRALDLIETTAMLEPRRLKDGTGKDVQQPSPLSTPAEAGDATLPAPSSSPGA
ncbi:hypothetical protein ABVV53_03015 [Novosphingobium sp. RD2P27]|uniref:Uroporphyrin-3 C-methyltransferase n=1 Tax=Novosphingobium kalidii TaxID=3230299 RepID=A0ABV2CXW8_9SPHN